jgi:hypothetical protein
LEAIDAHSDLVIDELAERRSFSFQCVATMTGYGWGESMIIASTVDVLDISDQRRDSASSTRDGSLGWPANILPAPFPQQTLRHLVLIPGPVP